MSEIDVEANARLRGWVPEEDFKGDKQNWRNAGIFMHNYYTGTLEAKLKENTDKMNEMSNTMDQLKNHHKDVLKQKQQEHEKKIKELLRDQRNAVKDGNTSEYDEITGKIDDLKGYVSDQSLKIDQKVSVEFEKFVDRNPWFLSDHEMRVVAEGISNSLLSANPTMEIAENMKRTESRIRKIYPNQFENQRRKSPTTVEDGSNVVETDKSKGKLTFSDLPKEAQAAGRKYVKESLFKSLDEYAKAFQKQ